MTPKQFREIALRQLEAVESAHMEHADFRVGGKIFATLGYPDDRHAVVMLPPDEQARFLRSMPHVFAAVKGAWGRNGATSILLNKADLESVENAVCLAWCKRAPARLLRQLDLPLER